MFIFSFIWVIPTFVLIENDFLPSYIAVLLTAIFSQGHKFVPIFLLFANQTVRKQVLRQRPNIFREISQIILLASLFGITAGVLFLYDQDCKAYLIPISGLGLIYTLWTYFHFSMQHFGILQIYRRRSRLIGANATIDLLTVAGITLFTTAIICTFSNVRMGFWLLFFEPLALPANLPLGMAGITIVIFLKIILRDLFRNSLTTPIFLSNASYASLNIMICFVPLAYSLLAISVCHWTQAVYLASLQMSGKVQQIGCKPYLSKLLIWMGAIVCFSIAVHFALLRLMNSIPIIGNFADISFNLKNYHPLIILSSMIFFGANLGINFVHFYLDRFVYRKNSFFY